MMWDDGFGGWWMWIPVALLPIVIIAGTVVLIVLLVRSSGGTGPAHGGAGPLQPDTARRLLEDRFARGEITPDQFRESIRVLNESRGR